MKGKQQDKAQRFHHQQQYNNVNTVCGMMRWATFAIFE
jgi:hypothetical protein